MLLFLVRHALTPATGKKLSGWLPGISLSEEGRKQAEALAVRLAHVPFNAIYTSPLERCVQTAEPVAKPRRMDLQTFEEMGEVRYGDWQGRSLKSLYRTKGWSELRARPGEFRFPNGETIREAQTRGMEGIETLRKRHRGKTVMVCSHADLIRLVVAGCLGLAIDLYDRISIGPATATVVYLGAGVPRLLKLSDSGTYEDVVARVKPAPRAKAGASR